MQWSIYSIAMSMLCIAVSASQSDSAFLHEELTKRGNVAGTPRTWLRATTASKSATNLTQATCYEYPDHNADQSFLAAATQVKMVYQPNTALNLTCWTSQARYPAYPDEQTRLRPNFDSLWFKTTDNCWVPDNSLQLPTTGANLAQQLSDLLIYCPHTLRQAGRLRDQYQWQTWCYQSASLNGDSSQFMTQPNGDVDLECWKPSENVRGDTTWWKVRNVTETALSQCWLPNQVFNPYWFSGNGHQCM